jgi:hypothetical protein
MRAYPRYGYPVKVLIIHDQDSNDCYRLKNELSALASPHIQTIIRIACRELENWYLGDLNAIERLYPESRATQLHKRYKDPDNVFGSEEMKRLCRNFSKSFASREIPHLIDIGQNRSTSFNHFVDGLRRLTNR